MDGVHIVHLSFRFMYTVAFEGERKHATAWEGSLNLSCLFGRRVRYHTGSVVGGLWP